MKKKTLFKHIPTGVIIEEDRIKELKNCESQFVLCEQKPFKFPIKTRADLVIKEYTYTYEEILFGEDFEIYNIQLDFTLEEIHKIIYAYERGISLDFYKIKAKDEVANKLDKLLKIKYDEKYNHL